MKGILSGSASHPLASAPEHPPTLPRPRAKQRHTYGDGLDGLGPHYRLAQVLSSAVIADLGLGRGSIRPAQQRVLRVTQRAARLDHEDGVDGARHGRESLHGLAGIRAKSSATPIILLRHRQDNDKKVRTRTRS